MDRVITMYPQNLACGGYKNMIFN